jgi:hypothetical protein
LFPTGAGAGFNMECFPTPRTFAPSPCGCPVGNDVGPNDFCEVVVPTPPNVTITYYYCNYKQSITCTDNTMNCGVGSHIWRCDYFECNTAPVPPGPPLGWTCNWTSKPNDCIYRWYGCSDDEP